MTAQKRFIIVALVGLIIFFAFGYFIVLSGLAQYRVAVVLVMALYAILGSIWVGGVLKDTERFEKEILLAAAFSLFAVISAFVGAFFRHL